MHQRFFIFVYLYKILYSQMKHMIQTRAWIAAGILLIAMGCNGDIFLDRNELPEYRKSVSMGMEANGQRHFPVRD